MNLPSVTFMGIKISDVNYRTTYQTLRNILNVNGRGYVCLNDVSTVMEATRDGDLRSAINQATIALADGMPLARFAQWVGCTEIERISGVHLMRNMFAEKDDFKHFLLGDTTSTIERVIEKAKELNDNIKIVGHSPPFKAFTDEDNNEILDVIKKENPDVIWVSFGGVKQEKWIYQQISNLDRGIMIGAGAAFRWLIGEIPTPPVILQNMGFQWMYRVAYEVLKDPFEARRFFKRRKFFKNRIEFIANLPGEIAKSRMKLRAHHRK